VASDATNLSWDSVNIPHEGPEDQTNMWQKVESIWSYIYYTYYNDFDWLHLGGDDMWVILDRIVSVLDRLLTF
jgi:glycoprotein-N-acetylgalactosamine 3-beta-galactosyltransferase